MKNLVMLVAVIIFLGTGFLLGFKYLANTTPTLKSEEAIVTITLNNNASHSTRLFKPDFEGRFFSYDGTNDNLRYETKWKYIGSTELGDAYEFVIKLPNKKPQTYPVIYKNESQTVCKIKDYELVIKPEKS
ncbi:MAG: hypothetical protein COA79_22510 [Planctomycetota bacterium]|nr:MAG: hypothetical protein COA79_22510 [Planctomycetota bacterium]